MTTHAQFSIGQVVKHKLFGYRGVIFDIDPVFLLSNEWYEQMAASKPPKDSPWYHVLVDNATHTTYVAQRNLLPDELQEEISNPLISEYFKTFENGRYLPNRQSS
jgi:heat shock protein HspQ